jgi:hypothetical protein
VLLGVGGGVGISVGLGVGGSVGITVGLGVGVVVSVGLGDGLGETPGSVGLGVTSVGGVPATRRWVVASAARMTVPTPLSVAGFATGLRSADGLGLTSGLGGAAFTATGDGWVAEVTRWRAPKYTRVNMMTRTISARLAATSVGANIDLIEAHRPFQRMAPSLLASRTLDGPFYRPVAHSTGLDDRMR